LYLTALRLVSSLLLIRAGNDEAAHRPGCDEALQAALTRSTSTRLG
jgi:hypothetical protein